MLNRNFWNSYVIKKALQYCRASRIFGMNDYYAHVTLSIPKSQNIILTTNQLTPINTNPIAACCRILNPFLYLASSPAAVTIWKPPRSKMTKAINANIPNIQLMKALMTLIRLPPCSLVAPNHVTPSLFVGFVQNHGWICANVTMLHTLSIPNPITDKAFNDNFFIFFLFLNKLKRLSCL